MSSECQIIELYTELAENPSRDFGWDKGLENAISHGYREEWIEQLPKEVWDYCAAVGNPFNDAIINENNTVVDLGCGAGIDLLVSSLLVGKSGKVFGVDITPKMVELAKHHAKLANADNVSILESSFDKIDLEDASVDVVISNGAINLTACKEAVFSEINRILKANGKIFFADMIDVSEPSNDSCCNSTNSCDSGEEDWANCVAGTLRENELIETIEKAGFTDVECTGYTHYTTAKTTKGATFKATKLPSSELRKEHWDKLYNRVEYTQVLWHQSSPQKSFEFIRKYANKDSTIIDVGCGASLLVDNLIENGYKDITLLDTAQKSLDIVKQRINDNSNVEMVCKDLLNYKADKEFDLWHDRAVLHFLLTKKEVEQYFLTLKNSLKLNGVAIISTFTINSETQCASLNTTQYGEEEMISNLPDGLELIECENYVHKTFKDSEQKYMYFVIKKSIQ